MRHEINFMQAPGAFLVNVEFVNVNYYLDNWPNSHGLTCACRGHRFVYWTIAPHLAMFDFSNQANAILGDYLPTTSQPEIEAEEDDRIEAESEPCCTEEESTTEEDKTTDDEITAEDDDISISEEPTSENNTINEYEEASSNNTSSEQDQTE